MLTRACCWSILVLMSGSPAVMQPAGEQKQVHVSSKPATAEQGSTFSTPVYLATAPTVKLKTLSLQMSYPKKSLTFATVEKGFLLQAGHFDVEATASPNARDASLETVKVQVKADSTDAASVLPAGLIVYLSFSVHQNAEQGEVTLQDQVVAAERSDGVRLSTANWSAESEIVTIVGAQAAPLSPCFFFLH